MQVPLHRVLPVADGPITIAEAYATPLGTHADRPWVGLCMVASIDGSTVVDGVSAGLSSDNDFSVLQQLRSDRPGDHRRRRHGPRRGLRQAEDATANASASSRAAARSTRTPSCSGPAPASSSPPSRRRSTTHRSTYSAPASTRSICDPRSSGFPSCAPASSSSRPKADPRSTARSATPTSSTS